MPRPNEIAADARALYGPPAVRPAAGAMGDGALWVDPGDNQALWQVQSGNWRQIALPPTDDDSSIPVGVPVLHGPYVVDYSAIPHDGDTLTLWTPQPGDVLLRLFADWQTATQWDTGAVAVGQQGIMTSGLGWCAYAGHGGIGLAPSPLAMDTSATGAGIAAPSGDAIYIPALVFRTTAPVQAAWFSVPDPDPGPASQGHVDLYALVARAVAP